jgi:hypothetical protein
MNDNDLQLLIGTISLMLVTGQGQKPMDLAKSIIDQLERESWMLYSSPHEVRAAVREMDTNEKFAGQPPLCHWR